jgi:hypothetical protein
VNTKISANSLSLSLNKDITLSNTYKKWEKLRKKYILYKNEYNWMTNRTKNISKYNDLNNWLYKINMNFF